MIKGVQDFAMWARDKSRYEIDQMVHNELPETIVNSILDYADADTCDPLHSALNAIGKAYGVDSLLNY